MRVMAGLRFLSIRLFFFLSFCAALPSQDMESNPEILNKALKVNLVVRIYLPGNEKTTAWEQKGEKITLPGKPVHLKLDGKVIKVYGLFTPYILKENELYLLAQGQVWLFDEEGKQLRYLSYFKSLPAVLGEKIIFLPLGLAMKSQNSNYYTIEIEIQIFPLTDKSDKGTASGDGR
jgi:hypothetical protein